MKGQLGWQDSNLRILESKSSVLPLDDTPPRTKKEDLPHKLNMTDSHLINMIDKVSQ